MPPQKLFPNIISVPHGFFRLFLMGLLVFSRQPAFAADAPQKAPDPKETSRKIYEWKSSDGVAFAWRGPKKVDPAQGVGLTLVLHGSNLNHTWGFANHNKDTFRPDDLVVCPDGTTPNGSGGFNFLDSPADVKKFHALLGELKAAFRIRGTYLYGHSQGSFFALKYAGEHPDEVDGVVAHASGLWLSSKTGPAGHRHAIVLMHGTLDPVVPYGQSVGAYDALKQAAYPMLRLRSLESWTHWPAEHNGPVAHTSQQLAWVEGMTTKDAGRLAASFATLAEVKNKAEHDWAGLYTLSRHVAASALAPPALKARAGKAIGIVEALTKVHAAALTVKPGSSFEKKAWPGHLPMFLRAFGDVPAGGELNISWKNALTAQQAAAAELSKAYYSAAGQPGKEAEAFEKGVALIKSGYLTYLNAEGTLAGNLAAWAKDAKKLKLAKEPLKDFEDIMEVVKQGRHALATINNKASAP